MFMTMHYDPNFVSSAPKQKLLVIFQPRFSIDNRRKKTFPPGRTQPIRPFNRRRVVVKYSNRDDAASTTQVFVGKSKLLTGNIALRGIGVVSRVETENYNI
jgi:hypothetical protein